MKNTRREFIKTSGFIAGSSLLFGASCNISSNKYQTMYTKAHKSGKLNLSYKPFDVQLKHVFTIAKNSRTSTAVSLVEIEFEGVTGYGEGSMPPYLGESHDTAREFISKVDLTQFNDPFRLEDILAYIDSIADHNGAIKSAIDIALHDLVGKLMGQPWYKIWGYDPQKTPSTSFTIGIDTPEVVKQKTLEAKEFNILKVKLGRENDKEMIETIRSVTNVPLCVDANQGWTDKQAALDLIFWLKEKGVVFIEQPMQKDKLDEIAWITQKSPLPIIADESLQRWSDIKNLVGVFTGINIKLAKCGGMREAHRMLETARGLGMKVMIGCMTETSCAISAAAQLSPMVDWGDLDGNLLINNDIFEGVKVVNGKITLNDLPGIGVVKINPEPVKKG
jgi:L-alanine-DL-glutamate epimerase-like enolase superfamily enzyme